MGQLYEYPQNNTSLTDQLEQYLSTPAESGYTDPATYWRGKLRDWPQLCMMARDYMAIMATSASSERCFSSGRDLLGVARHSMLPSTMQYCILLRSWYRAGIISDDPNAISLQIAGPSGLPGQRESDPVIVPHSTHISVANVSSSDSELDN